MKFVNVTGHSSCSLNSFHKQKRQRPHMRYIHRQDIFKNVLLVQLLNDKHWWCGVWSKLRVEIVELDYDGQITETSILQKKIFTQHQSYMAASSATNRGIHFPDGGRLNFEYFQIDFVWTFDNNNGSCFEGH